MQDCGHWLSGLYRVQGHKGVLERVQAGKEVPRLVNHLRDNTYKLIAPVGRDRNTFLELNTGTSNTRAQKARKETKEQKEQEAKREQRNIGQGKQDKQSR